MALLKENKYDETTHRLLIQMYVVRGRRHDAMGQYRLCEDILQQELGVGPLPQTSAALHYKHPEIIVQWEEKKQSNKRVGLTETSSGRERIESKKSENRVSHAKISKISQAKMVTDVPCRSSRPCVGVGHIDHVGTSTTSALGTLSAGLYQS